MFPSGRRPGINSPSLTCEIARLAEFYIFLCASLISPRDGTLLLLGASRPRPKSDDLAEDRFCALMNMLPQLSDHTVKGCISSHVKV